MPQNASFLLEASLWGTHVVKFRCPVDSTLTHSLETGSDSDSTEVDVPGL